MYYIKWVIGTRLGPYDGVIMNDVYTDGFDMCPWEMDQWKYEWEFQWYEDPTFTITCNDWFGWPLFFDFFDTVNQIMPPSNKRQTLMQK